MREVEMARRLLGPVCFLLLAGGLSIVHAAQLKDVRIGMHRGFSRVVFQLDALAEIEGPIIQGSGKCTFKLKNTESPFTSNIPGHSKAQVEGIELIQDGEDLIAYLRLRIDSFEVTSFSLPDPPRIVLDIYKLRAPLKKSPGIDASFNAPTTPVSHKSRLGKKAAETRPPLLDTTHPAEGSGPTDLETENTRSSDLGKESDRPDPRNPPELPAAPIQRSPVPAIAEKPTVTVLQTQTDSLRFYLPALLGLSVAILILLCILVFKKSSLVKTENTPVPDPNDTFDKTVAVIDERINEKLDQLGQNLRFHNR